MNIPYVLVFLACPVSMGLTMWLMMRGGHDETSAPPEHEEQRRRIAALERELAELNTSAHKADGDASIVRDQTSRSLLDV